jgi:hypothetical protein
MLHVQLSFHLSWAPPHGGAYMNVPRGLHCCQGAHSDSNPSKPRCHLITGHRYVLIQKPRQPMLQGSAANDYKGLCPWLLESFKVCMREENLSIAPTGNCNENKCQFHIFMGPLKSTQSSHSMGIARCSHPSKAHPQSLAAPQLLHSSCRPDCNHWVPSIQYYHQTAQHMCDKVQRWFW